LHVPGQLDNSYPNESEFDTIDRRVFDYTPVGDDRAVDVQFRLHTPCV
jgi:hypothetical protein